MIKALIDGWDSAMVRGLAARSLSLTELNRLITTHNYPSLERRLMAMRLAGLIEPCARGGRSRPYTATPVLRRAIGPLAAGAAWEREHLPAGTARVARIDVEAAFMLTLPEARLPSTAAGTCRLAVEIRTGGRGNVVGVLATIRDGRVVRCVTNLTGPADAWASGSSTAWLGAILLDETDRLEIGGDAEILLDLLDGIRKGISPSRSGAAS
jgi:hypothetical protein